MNLSSGIPSNLIGVDVGPNSEKKFDKVIKSSKTIFLNGSCGIFEMEYARNGSVGLVNVLIFFFLIEIFLHNFFGYDINIIFLLVTLLCVIIFTFLNFKKIRHRYSKTILL